MHQGFQHKFVGNEHSNKISSLFEQFETSGFYPKCVQPYRFCNRSYLLQVILNTFKSYSGVLISNMSDNLPHFTCLDILSNQQKTPKYVIKEKYDDASLLSFYNEIQSSLGNTDDPKWTNNRSKCDIQSIKKSYCLQRRNTWTMCRYDLIIINIKKIHRLVWVS